MANIVYFQLAKCLSSSGHMTAAKQHLTVLDYINMEALNLDPYSQYCRIEETEGKTHRLHDNNAKMVVVWFV